MPSWISIVETRWNNEELNLLTLKNFKKAANAEFLKTDMEYPVFRGESFGSWRAKMEEKLQRDTITNGVQATIDKTYREDRNIADWIDPMDLKDSGMTSEEARTLMAASAKTETGRAC
jgi:hypothetical protein